MYNGKVSTLDRHNSQYEAIGIHNGKITFLGETADALLLKKDYNDVVDLKGKLVLPGFNDSHLHVLGYGLTQKMLRLEKCRSIDEIIELGKGHIVKKGITTDDVLLGRGWNQDLYLNKRVLTRTDLDKISTTVPIILRRVCGHIAVVNSVVIERLDLLELLKNENVDLEMGTFEEDALELLNQLVETPSIDKISESILVSCKELLSYGITSVQSDDFSALPEWDYQLVIDAYQRLETSNQLPLRVYHQSLLPSERSFREFLAKGYKTGVGNEWFKIGPLKLLLDGSLGNRTAKMVEEYQDIPNNKGTVIYSQNELNRLIQIAVENDTQVAVHAIGDKAIYMTLDAIKRTQSVQNPLRHGVVHCQITNEEIIKRMSDDNIIAYIQPIFLDYDMGIVEQRIGKRRAKETYAFKTMMDKGIHLCGGSDAPVVHFNIFDNIYSAVTRKDLVGDPEKGWLPKERLSIDEALRLFTINGAYASFEEHIKGTLEIGKLGDVVVVDRDIYTIPEDDIRRLKVCYTVVDGKIVYESGV